MIYLKIPELKNGYTYEINARNASYGIWRKSKNSFIISRWKFGNYIFEEFHWDTGSGTVRPHKKIEKSPFDPEVATRREPKIIDGKEYWWIPDESKMLKYLNKFVEEP